MILAVIFIIVKIEATCSFDNKSLQICWIEIEHEFDKPISLVHNLIPETWESLICVHGIYIPFYNKLKQVQQAKTIVFLCSENNDFVFILKI